MTTILRFIVDANIFIHALNQASEHRAAAHGFLEGHWRAGTPWGTTWPILYEFLRVSTHPKVFAHPLTAVEAWDFVALVITNPAVTVLVDGAYHLEALAATIETVGKPAGSIFHDLHSVALMKEYGVSEIITADDGFRRFPHLTVTNPLTGS